MNTRTARDASGAAWMMVAAIILIGIGTVLRQLDVATLVVLLAFGAACVAVFGGRSPKLAQLTPQSVTMVVVASLVIGAVAFTSQTTLPLPAQALLLVLAAIGIHAVVAGGRFLLAEALLVIGGHFVLMAVMLATSGAPDIDVFVFQQEASAALLAGENPYAITFANPYGADSPYYAPEVVDGDRLRFGFIYPPVSLILALPGYVLAGDYRFAALAALSISAVLVVLIRPGRMSVGAALLILFAPVTQFVLFWGWTDPFVGLLLAATTLFVARSSGLGPIAMGLFVASKQYVLPVIGLGAMLLRRPELRPRMTIGTGVAALVGGATILPFLVWDPGSFVFSTIVVHVLQPFRDDSLSVPAMLVRNGLPQLPGLLGFVAGGIAFALVAWRAPRTLAGFCAGTAVVLMAFFLFGKQAFLHYYFLPLVALAIGVAAASPAASTATDGRPAA